MKHILVSAKKDDNISVLEEMACVVARKKSLKTRLPLRDIYLSFLLELNEDFDDDLMQDATKILVD